MKAPTRFRCEARRLLVVALLLLLAGRAARAEEKAPLAESFLTSGKLTEGEKTLVTQLAANPKDNQVRFGLGVLQFVRAVEHLAQNLHRYGLRDLGRQFPLPIVRLPLPENPDPEVISYEQWRKLLQSFIDNLAVVNKTLEPIRGSDVKLPLHFAQVRLDLNGDGRAEVDESLWQLLVRFNAGAAGQTPAGLEQLVIAFDQADAHWLCGYCHLLSALMEFALLYDAHEQFERTGHLFFARVDGPYDFLARGSKVFAWGEADIMDLIALIHTTNFPVKDPERGPAILKHLEAVIAESRLSWEAILAETDNDREWIPGPKQQSVVPGVTITPEMVTAWREFLAEADDMLQGKKLIPFWRASDARVGVNLRKVFTDPQPFDLVLWIQGTGAAPFLEKGPLTTPEAWQRWQRVFRGEFIGFAIWFN